MYYLGYNRSSERPIMYMRLVYDSPCYSRHFSDLQACPIPAPVCPPPLPQVALPLSQAVVTFSDLSSSFYLPAYALVSSWKEPPPFLSSYSDSLFKLFLALPGILRGSFC